MENRFENRFWTKNVFGKRWLEAALGKTVYNGLVDSWSMVHVRSMVQDEDVTMWVAEREVFVV